MVTVVATTLAVFGVWVLRLSELAQQVVRDVVVKQLPKLAALTPAVVPVVVGANDIRDYDVGRFDADFDALVAALPASAVVGDVPWFMHGGTGRRSDDPEHPALSR